MYKETKKKKKNQKQNQIICSSEINDSENKIYVFIFLIVLFKTMIKII